MINYSTSREDLEPNLSRQIKLAIQGLEVFKCLTSHQLLVQPYFMISGRPGQKMFADIPCKREHLGMQFGYRWNRRTENIPLVGGGGGGIIRMTGATIGDERTD